MIDCDFEEKYLYDNIYVDYYKGICVIWLIFHLQIIDVVATFGFSVVLIEKIY